MQPVYQVLTLALLAAICYSAEENEKHAEFSDLQVFIAPRRNQSERSVVEDNTIETEDKSIQLQIRTGNKPKNRVDLIIAATKEVQSTPETVNRYSPKYNAATDDKMDPHSVNLKDVSSSVFGSPPQSTEPLYAPEDYADLFPAMRSLLPPSLFPMDFSPMHSLRHMEDNYNPHSLSDGMRHMNGPLVMSNPFYRQHPVQYFGHQIHSNPNSLEGVAEGLTQQQPHNNAAYKTPQRVPIIQSIPMHPYLPAHPASVLSPERNLQQAFYRSVQQEPNAALSDSLMRNNPRQQRLLSHSDQHMPLKIQETVPTHPHEADHLKQSAAGRYLPQTGAPSHTPSLYEQDHLRELQRNMRLNKDGRANHLIGLYRHPLSVHQDKHLLYTAPQQDPTLPKATSEAGRANDGRYAGHPHDHRAINMGNEKPAHPLNDIHRNLPHYTLVPDEALPNYLKEQQQSHHQTSLGSLRPHPGRPLPESAELRSSHHRHSRLPNDDLMKRDIERQFIPQGLPSLPLSPLLQTTPRHYPHRNVYLKPSYETQGYGEGSTAASSNGNQGLPYSGRPSFEMRQTDLDNLPRKKYLKKNLRGAKTKELQLEGESSHQYTIIKIR